MTSRRLMMQNRTIVVRQVMVHMAPTGRVHAPRSPVAHGDTSRGRRMPPDSQYLWTFCDVVCNHVYVYGGRFSREVAVLNHGDIFYRCFRCCVLRSARARSRVLMRGCSRDSSIVYAPYPVTPTALLLWPVLRCCQVRSVSLSFMDYVQ